MAERVDLFDSTYSHFTLTSQKRLSRIAYVAEKRAG